MLQFDNQYFNISICSGILLCTMKDGCVITKTVSDSMISERINISHGKEYPIILDARNVKYWTMSSRNNAMKEYAFDLLELAAIVIDKKPLNVIWKYTIRLFPIPIKNELFFDLNSAEQWVKKESKLLNG